MILQILASSARVSTPLILAAMGGLLCERAGVINLALEGMMLMGALGGAVGTLWTHSAWLGSGVGILAGIAMAAIYALCVLPLRANQVIAGMAMNLMALGLAPLICKSLYDVTGSTPSIPLPDRWQIAPAVLAWVAVASVWIFLRFSRSGLHLLFCGEEPRALDAAGVNVVAIRWKAVLSSGALAGFAGACLSTYLSSGFSRNMTAGRGFIAVAALIFGKWRPIPTAMACLMFGFVEAVQIRLQSAVPAGEHSVPPQVVQALPYLITVLVLAGIIGRARAPKALGIHFSRQ